MKCRIAITCALIGCTGEGGFHGDAPPSLPAGVWEPIPGAYVYSAEMTLAGDTVWWAVRLGSRPPDETLRIDEPWIAATTLTGESVIAPFLGPAAFYGPNEPDVVATPTAVVATNGGRGETVFAHYGRDGQLLDRPCNAYEPNELCVVSVGEGSHTAFIATAHGGVQYIAAGGGGLAVVDFDADGIRGPVRRVEVYQCVRSVAAAARPDGSTLAAWAGDDCSGSTPGSAYTMAIDQSGFGVVQPVFDGPGRESNVVVATRGEAAYVAWIASSAIGDSRVSLARYPDIANVIAEPGVVVAGSFQQLSFALAAPDRGAIVSNVGSQLHVTPFEDRGDVVYVGEPYVRESLHADSGIDVGKLLHVGGNRYLLCWTESRERERPRLYATEVDFTHVSMRPAIR